jgi:hypothetical protein
VCDAMSIDRTIPRPDCQPYPSPFTHRPTKAYSGDVWPSARQRSKQNGNGPTNNEHLHVRSAAASKPRSPSGSRRMADAEGGAGDVAPGEGGEEVFNDVSTRRHLDYLKKKKWVVAGVVVELLLVIILACWVRPSLNPPPPPQTIKQNRWAWARSCWR